MPLALYRDREIARVLLTAHSGDERNEMAGLLFNSQCYIWFTECHRYAARDPCSLERTRIEFQKTFWREQLQYTQCVQNIRSTFLILSCTHFCPQNSLNSPEHGVYKVLKAFNRNAGRCWLQCFPRLSSWLIALSGGGPFLIHTGNCWVVLDTQTGWPGPYYHTPFKGT